MTREQQHQRVLQVLDAGGSMADFLESLMGRYPELTAEVIERARWWDDAIVLLQTDLGFEEK